MNMNKPNSQQLGIWRGVTTSFHVLYFVINGKIHQHCKQMFGFLLKILFFKIMKFAILWVHDSHTKKIN
jgi:hypothetical protein